MPGDIIFLKISLFFGSSIFYKLGLEAGITKGFKMKLSIILVSILSLTGCGRDLSIDPELEPLLDLYLEHAPNVGRISSLRSLTIGEPVGGVDGAAGICSWEQWGIGKQIAIGIEYRIIISPIGKGTAIWKSVVFHELAHCLHGFVHNGQDPYSIMAAENLGSEEFWQEHLLEKLDEMFKYTE